MRVAASMALVVAHDGAVIVRINLDNAPMETARGDRFELLPHLRKLRHGQVGEWSARLHDEHGTMAVRERLLWTKIRLALMPIRGHSSV